MKYWQVVEQARMINKILEDKGYTHRIQVDEIGHKNTRTQISFVDENKYHCREYGCYSHQNAYNYLFAFEEGLKLGLM